MNAISHSTLKTKARDAFTLLEMLMVIGIIGIIAALTAPTLKSLGRPDVLATALRQVNDDLNLARLLAINGRTPVYVVFFPNESALNFPLLGIQVSNYFSINRVANRLLGGQLSAYAIYAGRSLGDQPGQSVGHYLTDWKYLPRGVYFDTNIFYNTNIFFNSIGYSNLPITGVSNPLKWLVVPDDSQYTATNVLPVLSLPYIGFDPQGRVLGRTSDLILPVSIGALNYRTDPPYYTNYSMADPGLKPEPGYRGVDIMGTDVRPGVTYVVTGGGTVLYNGITYVPGQVFRGVFGVPVISIGNTNNTFVREVNGVAINWLTGRSRIQRADTP